MKKILNLVLKTISSLIVIIAVSLAILLVGFKFLGFQIYTVISGSMEPTYHVGSLIYVKEVDPDTLKEKDSITFQLGDNTIATHRIIEIVYDEENSNKYSFRTKGDANKNPDANLVEPDKVLGKAIFTVPYLGYLATYVQSSPGNLVAIFVSIALIILVIILDTIAEDKVENDEQAEEKVVEEIVVEKSTEVSKKEAVKVKKDSTNVKKVTNKKNINTNDKVTQKSKINTKKNVNKKIKTTK